MLDCVMKQLYSKLWLELNEQIYKKDRLMKQSFQSDCYKALLNDFHLLWMIYWSPDQNLQHICTTFHEVTTTDKYWPIFSPAVKIRDSQFIKWEREISCDQKNITFNWQTSAESHWSRSLYHPYHYPHHHHDHYHSRLPPAGHMLPCVHGWNNEGLLLSIQLSTTHRWLLISNTQKN